MTRAAATAWPMGLARQRSTTGANRSGSVGENLAQVPGRSEAHGWERGGGVGEGMRNGSKGVKGRCLPRCSLRQEL